MLNGVKFLIISMVLLFVVIPSHALAQERLFIDYVGRTLRELTAGEGLPHKAVWADTPMLTLIYNDKVMRGISYNVHYTINGVDVVAASCYPVDGLDVDLTRYSASPERGLVDYMGKTRAEILALEGPPRYHTMSLYNIADEIAFGRKLVNGRSCEVVYELEQGRVYAISYQYHDLVEGRTVETFLQTVDAEVMALLDDPVWVQRDFHRPPEAPEYHYQFIRLAAAPNYNINYIGRGWQEKKRAVFTLSIAQRGADGYVGRMARKSHDEWLATFWYHESGEYKNSGNLDKLATMSGQ